MMGRGHGFDLNIRVDFDDSDADHQVYRRVLVTRECSLHAA
jgi:hypothetical protein